ncbi:AraC family transcriptional regulator [Vibrio sp. S4M6]|uniref:AraC family transcriptional regulator n=1 Tax=Vibrio sinus TaxID=2946865 RepID=UPI00202A0F1C|nr:GyrI-like domain-containing protein [Vibrio sinus]MCL9780133.1 AraC family transcriptional regulator [Vibrio sinus]
MKDEQRVQATIDYIGQHLDEELSLDTLCKVACFSKFHFHRLFTAYTGLSLQQYIRWLRLKRAAHQLVVDHTRPIIEVALEAGFESRQSFTRAFKQVCGSTPGQFRSDGSWRVWESPPYIVSKLGENAMDVIVKQVSSRRLAVLEHRGDPSGLGQSVNRLVTWAKSLPINVKPSAGDAFGFAYDDPATTPAEKFRFDLALTVPESLVIEDKNILDKRLPEGKYAIAVHKGSRDSIGDTIYAVLRDWLPQSGESLEDFPCLFCYQNFDHEVADTELVTECWFLLQS